MCPKCWVISSTFLPFNSDVFLILISDEKKPGSEDAVFMEEDVAPSTSDHEMMDEDGGLTDVQEPTPDDPHTEEKAEEVAPDETIHEQAVGKGLGGTLQLLKDRGTLKETIEWGGRNMDKKKSKLVGIVGGDGTKEIRIERTDEYGRIVSIFSFTSDLCLMFASPLISQ